ncbi:MAG: DUF2934 domain-containing protein [Candidatus Acidiferrales bacterium]|jgi:hypothetical protein
MADRSFAPTQEDISRRAYEIYVSRGRKHGGDIEDWLAAEQDLRERQSTTSQTKKPLMVTGTVMDRTVLLSERNPESGVADNFARNRTAPDNTARESNARESDTHFKLPRNFLGSNP